MENNNMKRIEKSEIQSYILNIMKAFKKFAAENNIEFTLGGGTLLGAVRHKGFIPWDDDADIYISTESREKLIRIAETNPYIDEDNRYKILVPGVFPSTYPFIKIIDTHTLIYELGISKKYAIGIYIDIFCLSYWPDSIEESEKLLKKIQFCRKMRQVMVDGNNPKLKGKILWLGCVVLRFVFNILGLNTKYWCNKIIKLGSYPESEFIGDVCWPLGINDRIRTKCFKNTIEVSFEDEKFLIAEDYDEILKTLYGDYMKLPPINERQMHNFEAYYIGD